MPPTRKQISLRDKFDILSKIDSGEKIVSISKQYKLAESTVRTIQKNAAIIKASYQASGEVSASKSSYNRNLVLVKTERALSHWIEDCSQKRIPLDVKSLKAKAIQFSKTFEDSDPSVKSFQFSNGWLNGFLKRNSFHNVKISGESASANEEAAKEFPNLLLEKITTGGYVADQVFNADETALFWKKMPQRTYVSKNESNVKGWKASKDRVTLLFCSNASGDKMLKPLLVNKSAKPRALKGVDRQSLPVHFMANKKAWVTSKLFTEWFNGCFIPEVREYLARKRLEFKVLLIIDNAPGHPIIDHPNVQIVFLPPNTTSLIQPLDQGIIASFKAHYIKNSFALILKNMEQDNEFNVTSVWKKFSLKDCIGCINTAIKSITQTTLNNCWKKIWKEAIEVECDFDNLSTYADIFEIAHDMGGEGFEDFCIDDLNELFETAAISDDEILEAIDEDEAEKEEENENDSPNVTSTNLTAAKIKKGLEMARELQNYFTLNDPNSERTAIFERDLKKTMTLYEEEYQRTREKLPQKLLTDFFK